MTALWNAVCLAFPTLERLSLAGARPITWVQLLREPARLELHGHRGSVREAAVHGGRALKTAGL